jgi:hypothetical protein
MHNGRVGVRVPYHPASSPIGTERFLQGTGGGVKRQEREADYSLPTGADVKKTWIYTSTPPYVFKA